MNKLTPNLIVDAIEPCLPFWVERLGFEKAVEVPEGERLGFVILKRGSVEVMLQTRASVAKDVGAISDGLHRSVLYIDVPDLAAIRTALGVPRPICRRSQEPATRAATSMARGKAAGTSDSRANSRPGS